ncbi:MAG: DUF1836 domain-containing protein [Hungatella sp.]|nr:DUF1836 domain-containing protein [Hungatella sp.]
MKSNEELLREIFARLDALDYVRPEQIPDIPLYMDQLTTFMDERLEKSKRYPEDKVLTKTMINNYAKNNLLPPPIKKKYSKEHTLLLIFIYYFKNMLSFHDIEALFAPITEEHFASDHDPLSFQSHAPGRPSEDAENASWSLEDIYREIFSLEKEQMKRLKEDLIKKYRCSMKAFSSSHGDSGEYLRLFSFICELGFDVYLKKQMMEFLIDYIREEYPQNSKKKK